MKIDHINAQSILANKDELKLLINERKADIFCVSESWLSPEVPNEHVSITNYVLYRCDAGRGGGVCVYVKDTFKVTPVNVNLVRPKGVEDVWVAVQSKNLPTVIIGCLYRHPKALAESFNYITDVLNHINLRNK